MGQVETIADGITLHLGDCREILPAINEAGSIVLDPPFNEWGALDLPKSDGIAAFTNWQNRETVTDVLGPPRIEIIWHFMDGRWVSPTMPRITHETILIYGKTNNADLGSVNPNAGAKIKKGRGSIGKDDLGERVYMPKDRKQLNSVLCYPRNVNSEIGVWTKPVGLMTDICGLLQGSILDPFMGSGSAGIAAIKLGRTYTGIENNKTHFDIACRRLTEALNQKDIFAERTPIVQTSMLGAND